MRVTILGCGSSGGVPTADGTPGGNWGACDPGNPKNRRRRVSILVGQGATALLVDTSPDLRDQILDTPIAHLDAVLYTHAHADHAHGLDELRGLVRARGGPIDAYMDPATHARLTVRFAYAFETTSESNELYPPLMRPRIVGGPFRIGPIEVVPIRQGHGPGTTLGFRFGPLAYSTDVVSLDEAAFAALAGVRVWIVDCLREEPHPTHSHLAQTLEWIERVGPSRAVLTHMNTQADYAEIESRCPAGVEPAYDGMVIEVNG